MRRIVELFVFGVASLFVLGCRPSLESKSAGQIGCLPSEIKVRGEETDTGYSQSTSVWIAECRGREYVCSEVLTAASQVRCSERSGAAKTASNASEPRASTPGDEEPSSTGASTESEPSAAPSKKPVPASAAGFVFDQTKEATKAACEQAGHSWTDVEGDGGECSGPAEETGFPATVVFQFCGEAICGAGLVFEPSEGWTNSIASIRSALVDKYGPSGEDDVRLPKECLPDEKFVECLAKGRARVAYSWSWETGEKVKFRVKKGDEENAPRLEIVYSRNKPVKPTKNKTPKKIRANSSTL